MPPRLRVRITYCKRCDYHPQVHALVKELELSFPETEVISELVEGDRGIFDVEVEGKLVFSKDATDRFPMYQEIPITILQQAIGL